MAKINKMTAEEIRTRLSTRDGAISMHKEALAAGLTFSRYLELADPSPEDSRLDAFQRQLKLNGIQTRSIPEAGIWAGTGDDFLQTVEGRALFSEFFCREWRKVSFANSEQRAILLSSDSVIGGFDRPYVDAAGPRWNSQFAAPIPLTEIVAFTTPITGEDYRSAYMTYDAEALRMYRVGESAEIPMATLTSSARAIQLKKYGRGMRTSYEQLRRMRIDRIAWWIRWMALQAEIDKVTAALNVLINGDGNANTGATEINQSTLDSTATPGELSTLGWLKFRMQWAPPYQLTTILAQIDEAVQVIMLNLGTANLPLEGRRIGGIGNSLTPINSTADGVRYGWTADAPDGKIVGFDRRNALEQVVEIGSNISETENFITNQTQVITMTENNAFAIIDPAATKLLDLAE